MVFDELAGKPAGLFYSINGLIFGNLPGLMMKKAKKFAGICWRWETRLTCTLRIGMVKS